METNPRLPGRATASRAYASFSRHAVNPPRWSALLAVLLAIALVLLTRWLM